MAVEAQPWYECVSGVVNEKVSRGVKDQEMENYATREECERRRMQLLRVLQVSWML